MWHKMLVWLSRWLTKSVAFSGVAFSICVGGNVARTPTSSCVIACSNACSAVAILSSSSGSLDLRGTFPSHMAPFTSETNWSVFSLGSSCASSLKWNHSCWEVLLMFSKHLLKSSTTSVDSCCVALSIRVSVGLNASGMANNILSTKPWLWSIFATILVAFSSCVDPRMLNGVFPVIMRLSSVNGMNNVLLKIVCTAAGYHR